MKFAILEKYIKNNMRNLSKKLSDFTDIDYKGYLKYLLDSNVLTNDPIDKDVHSLTENHYEMIEGCIRGNYITFKVKVFYSRYLRYSICYIEFNTFIEHFTSFEEGITKKMELATSK